MSLFKEKFKRSLRIVWNELKIIAEYFVEAPKEESKQLIRFIKKISEYILTPVLAFYLFFIYLVFLILFKKDPTHTLIVFILWLVVLVLAIATSPSLKKWYKKKYNIEEPDLLSEK